MARLLVHVEGETEESFVNELLAGHLYTCGYELVSGRMMISARRPARSWSAISVTPEVTAGSSPCGANPPFPVDRVGASRVGAPRRAGSGWVFGAKSRPGNGDLSSAASRPGRERATTLKLV